MASIWAPASKDASHVGHAGAGVVSLRGAPLSLPSIATVQFQRFFDRGRAVRCVLLLRGGGVMQLVVLYGYQGAGRDPERLALIEQLLDAALGELSVVGSGVSPVCWLVTSTWSPPRFLSGQKGSWLGSGLIWRHLGPFASGKSSWGYV